LTREKMTRSEQREAARAKAKTLREQHKKDEKRKSLLVKVGVGVGLVAVIGGIALAVASGADKPLVEPTNMSFDDGIKMGTNLEAFTPDYTPKPGSAGAGAPNIKIYLDYQCPYCQQFELPNQSQIEKWVSTGAATVEIHPISFLDGRGSPNEYSSRAANAAVCVAEYSPNNFYAFNGLLFSIQPEEGTAGPSNDEIFAQVKASGANATDEIKTCIDEKRFTPWIKEATDRALYEPLPGSGLEMSGTPFILINDQVFKTENPAEFYSPARFAQFLQTVASN
jgi:protein-disulfide isomerase